MAFGDDAQNTWDKLSDDKEKPMDDQLDGESVTEMPGATAADAGDASSSDTGFREHIGQEDAMLSGDMAGDMSTMPTDESAAEAELDSDRDYDTDMEEAPGDAFMDRDSF